MLKSDIRYETNVILEKAFPECDVAKGHLLTAMKSNKNIHAQLECQKKTKGAGWGTPISRMRGKVKINYKLRQTQYFPSKGAGKCIPRQECYLTREYAVRLRKDYTGERPSYSAKSLLKSFAGEVIGKVFGKGIKKYMEPIMVNITCKKDKKCPSTHRLIDGHVDFD